MKAALQLAVRGGEEGEEVEPRLGLRQLLLLHPGRHGGGADLKDEGEAGPGRQRVGAEGSVGADRLVRRRPVPPAGAPAQLAAAVTTSSHSLAVSLARAQILATSSPQGRGEDLQAASRCRRWGWEILLVVGGRRWNSCTITTSCSEGLDSNLKHCKTCGKFFKTYSLQNH